MEGVRLLQNVQSVRFCIKGVRFWKSQITIKFQIPMSKEEKLRFGVYILVFIRKAFEKRLQFF